MFLVQIFENNEEVGTLSFLSNMFQSYCHSKNFSKFCKSLKLTLSAKTVAFVKITCQTFCSYAGLFLFSKATKFDFLLWLLWPTQKDFFFPCLSSFRSKLKILRRLDKLQHPDKGNALECKTHNSLTWSNKMTFQRATLPSKPEAWRVFWPLQCFKVWVHLQHSVSHLGHGRA